MVQFSADAQIENRSKARLRCFFIELEVESKPVVDGSCSFSLPFFGYLIKKEASGVVCSVVKHVGSGRARENCWGKRETQSSVCRVVFLCLSALQENIAQSKFLYLFCGK